MRCLWIVVGHWKGDPDIFVQQSYGPFAIRKDAVAWVKKHREPSWEWHVSMLYNPLIELGGHKE